MAKKVSPEAKIMRVYHFVNKNYGIDDIRNRRLKVATINELNDPFELFSVDLSNKSHRKALREIKKRLSSTHGLLCFSSNWQNPVQWSHYANKHQGLCLGFDIPRHMLHNVSYTRKRLVVETEDLPSSQSLDQDQVMKFLLTKYRHWSYEKEVRQVVSLYETVSENGLYFVSFSNDLKLVQVIVGSESRLTRNDIADALGNLVTRIEVFKARLAFKSFRVVHQKNQKLWV